MDIHLTGVCERDVDLLLLQEFAASSKFVQWFVGSLTECDVVETVSISRSVTQSNGESDLELLLKTSSGNRILVLIENKVAASFQKDQAFRYQERAKNYLATGDAEDCLIVLVAPESYLSGTAEAQKFDAAISYESIQNWLASNSPDERKGFSTYLLTAAIEKATKGYNPVEDQPVTHFWQNYWELVAEKAPELEMGQPEGKPAGAGFVHFRPAALPRNLKIVHKLGHGNMDLEISGGAQDLPNIFSRVESLLANDMTVVRTGQSAAIRISVPQLNTAAPFESQQPAVFQALNVAKRLLEWARENKGLL